MKKSIQRSILYVLTISFVLGLTAVFHVDVQAQEASKSRIYTLAVEAAADRPPKPGYAPYVVNTVHVDDAWGYAWGWVDLHSFPIEDDQSAGDARHGIVPIVKFGIARYHAAIGWEIYLEDSQVYPTLLNDLPASMQWLQQIHIPRVATKNQAAPIVNLPNLPYATGAAWRYLFGPTADHFPTHALDFGTLPRNQTGNVYAMDHGVVVLKGDTCLIIQHNNVRAMYQHILHTGMNLGVGSSVTPGQLLGKTTVSPGCSGSTTTDHVHIHFQDPVNDSIVEMIGNVTLNGWRVEGTFGATKLTKGNVSVNAAENLGLIPHANMTCQEGSQFANPPPVILYSGENCQSITLSGQVTDSQPIFQQEVSGAVHGIFIPYGYRAILTHISDNQAVYQACFEASVDHLQRFFYENTAIPVGGDTVTRVKFRKIQNIADGCEAPYPAIEPTCPGPVTFCGSTLLPPDYGSIYLPLVRR